MYIACMYVYGYMYIMYICICVYVYYAYICTLNVVAASLCIGSTGTVGQYRYAFQCIILFMFEHE